jgi:hypothetical protein
MLIILYLLGTLLTLMFMAGASIVSESHDR